MKCKILPIIFFFFSGVSLFSQLDSYDISKYALPELKYQMLDVDFDIAGTSREYGLFNENKYRDEFLSRIELSYFKRENSKKYQRSLGASFRESYNFLKDEDISEDKIKISNSLNSGVYVSSENKFFYKEKRFFEVDGYINLNGNNRVQKDENEKKIKAGRYSSITKLGLFYGFGRVEDVTDAWKAIRILSDFEKFGLLNSNPGDEQIIDLSELISQRGWMRYFDYRLKRIEDIKKVDEFFQNSGLINDFGSTYFTSLYDMWSYGTNYSRRLSGHTFSFGVKPAFFSGYNRITDNMTDKYMYLEINILGGVKYELHKPINLNWQFDMDLDLLFGPTYKRNDAGNLKFFEDEGYFLTDFVISYCPNTRTILRSSIGGVANFQNIDKRLQRDISYSARFRNSLYYYISPRTRLNFDLSMNLGESYLLNKYFSDLYNFNYFLSSAFYISRVSYGVSITHDLF